MFEDETVKLAKEGMSVEEIASVMPQYENKRSAMYRHKWSTRPKIPSNLQDLIFDNELYKNTLTHKRFLLIDCYESEQRITIFCSDRQLKLLGQAKIVGADGTFSSRPSLYEQLYIIMAWFKGEVLPAAFVLLGGKKGCFIILL